MPNFNEQLAAIAAARQAHAEAAQALYRARLDVQKRLDPTNLADMGQGLNNVTQRLTLAERALQTKIAALYEAQQPWQLAANLDAALPVLLLPLHLETRFVNAADGKRQLWVRIYPDDIAIHTHEPLLTEKEIEAGKNYWTTLLKINHLDAASIDREAARQAAWKTLNEPLGQQRSLWVAQQTRPANWTPDLQLDPADLQFPEQADTKTHAWTQAPRTQVLPDKFVVHILRGDTVVHRQAGANVPDTVFLGPDPFRAEEAYKKNPGAELEFDESFAWMSDFEKAVGLGLGLKIDLLPQFFAPDGRLERIVVLGLLLSADAGKTQQMVEDLFENHHFSQSGLGFVPQGTPTNNTEAERSGYSQNDDLLPKGYFDGAPAPLPADSDARRLAASLGIAPNHWETMPHADLREAAEARAMNGALYEATLGYFFGTLLKPVLGEPDLRRLRAFFTDFVSARGPLPALRVGDQPYGIVVTSDLRRWNDDTPFFQKTTSVLLSLQAIWDSFAAQADWVGKADGADPSARLLKILALEAGSASFFQRLGNLPDFCYSLPAFLNDTTFAAKAASKQEEIVQFLRDLGYRTDVDGHYYPYASQIFFYDKHGVAFGQPPIPAQNLVDGKRSSPAHALEKSFLVGSKNEGGIVQPVLGNYIEWLLTAQLSQLQNLVFHAQETPPNQVLFLLMRHALLRELLTETGKFYAEKDIHYDIAGLQKSLFNFKEESRDLTSWHLLNGAPKTVDAEKFSTLEKPLGEHLLAQARLFPFAETPLPKWRSHAQALTELPTARLERLLTEHLDCCAYRLDAWETGLFARRLDANRAAHPQGLYLGAFGWLEDLRPATALPVAAPPPELVPPPGQPPLVRLAENAGFIHAPSLNHATATGLLLAGYHNHARREAPGDFAVNLSSDRTRRAMSLLEGLRNGQRLEALLGYQFERGLHDATTHEGITLNQYVLDFREKYPIEQRPLPQAGVAEAAENVPVFGVVNGLKLQEDSEGNVAAVAVGATATERNRILQEKRRLDDTLDAAKDLLLAEGAYQLALGNFERGGAVLNSLKNAQFPPELQVAATPRTTELAFTNRVSLHVNASVSFQNEDLWHETPSPRARLESGLNLWLSQVLGDARTVFCKVVGVPIAIGSDGAETEAQAVSLGELNLQAIDFIYLIGKELQSGATELEARVAQVFRQKIAAPDEVSIKIYFDDLGAAVPPAGARTFAEIFPLALALRSLATGSRPAHAGDFLPATKTLTTSKDPNPRNWDVADLQTRLAASLTALKKRFEKFELLAPNGQNPKTEDNPANFGALFAGQLEKSRPELFANLPLTQEALGQIRAFREDMALYGIRTAFPAGASEKQGDTLAQTFALWRQVRGNIATAEAKIAAAVAETEADAQIARLTEAGKALLGEDFNILPHFHFRNAEDIRRSNQDREQLLAHGRATAKTSNQLLVETWAEGLARVRPKMALLERVRLLAEALSGAELPFRPVQLPFREKDSWLAVELPAVYEPTGKKFGVFDDTIAATMLGPVAFGVDKQQVALIVDDWTEAIPTDREVTGIAYHYNQPNAAPPQCLLLAVSPQQQGHWDWDALLGTVLDTLGRARRRVVEPAQISQHATLGYLLPMTAADFNLQNTNISLDYGVANTELLKKMVATDMTLYAAYAAKHD